MTGRVAASATVVGAILVAAAGAAPARAAVTIGVVAPIPPGGGGVKQIDPPPVGTPTYLGGPVTYVQSADVPGVASYAAPSPGVITAWRTRIGAMVSSTFTFAAVRPAADGSFFVVGTSQVVHTGVLSSIDDVTVPTRIPVAAGDRIALGVPAGSVALEAEVVSGGTVAQIPGGPQGTLTPGTLQTGRRLQLEATLEPDADGDGYGDQTQDACPADPARQAPPCAAPGTGPAPGAPAPTTADVAVTGLALHGRTVTFSAPAAGTVVVRLVRLVDGRRRRAVCAPPTRRTRALPRCVRRVLAARLTASVGSGPVSLVLGARPRPGRYQLSVALLDPAGRPGPAAVRRLTVRS